MHKPINSDMSNSHAGGVAKQEAERVLVIQAQAGLEKLKKAANVYGAPLVFVVCADHAGSWKRPFDGMDAAPIDASIVTAHMMLEAADLGLGTIWVCHFRPDVLRAEFALPEGVEPVNILGVGYAAEEGKSPERHVAERRPLAGTVYFESF